MAITIPALSDTMINPSSSGTVKTIFPSSEGVLTIGRVQSQTDGAMTFGYPGAGVIFKTNSKQVFVHAQSSGDSSFLGIRIDKGKTHKIKLDTKLNKYLIFEQLDNTPHNIEIIHHSETWHGLVTLKAFDLYQGALLAQVLPKKRILVIGDSVTCGEGTDIIRDQEDNKNTSWWNAFNSYGWRTAEALNAQVQLVCHGGRGLIRSWNGKTDEQNAPDYYQLTYGLPGAPKWNQAQYSADLIVVSIGTNDFSLGIGALPTEQAYVPPYVAFTQTLLSDHPGAHIVLTDGAIVNDFDDPARPQRSVLRNYLNKTKTQVGSNRVHVFHAGHFPGDSKDAHPTGPQHQLMSEELVAFVRKNIAGW